MNNFVRSLVENHRAFHMPILHIPGMPDMNRVRLREELICEEATEFIQANKDGDIVSAADALIDLLYVTIGAMLEYGLTDIVDDLFNEVQRSNMSKLDETGQPIFRADGKYLKGPRYTEPNLSLIINNQIDDCKLLKAGLEASDRQLELDL